MNRTALLACLCVAALPAHAAAQVSAEPWFRAGTLMLTAEVGGAAFSDFERTTARPVGSEAEEGGFSRRISAQTAASAGASISYWIGNGWGIRAGVSYAPSSFTVWQDRAAEHVMDTGGIMEEQERSYAALGIWMANAGVVFKFPHSFGRVVPYGMAGAGLVRYQPSKDAPLPAEARRRFAESSLQHAAGMFGVGASIPLQRSDLLLSFELTNHMSKTPLRGEGAGETFELHGVPMVIDPEGDVSGENDVGVTSHVRLAIGLTLPLR